MKDEPSTDPVKEPGKEITPAPKPAAPNFRTHCPGCSRPAAVIAKAHCPNNAKCHWRICACGTTWDKTNGRHYPAQTG